MNRDELRAACPRRLAIAATVTCAGLFAMPAQADDTVHPTIEMRITAAFTRPYDFPSLCPMLAFPLTRRLWIGGGYELIQDYDAIIWKSNDEGHTPVAMSGIRAGAWYRGGPAHEAMSFALGGLVTFSSPTVSLVRAPSELDSGSYAVDLAADFSIGHIWQGFRVEGFATPAWSWGRFSSTTLPDKQERLNAFTYRIGVALAIMIGS
jgi:hypothetical protein